jgi:hypothetical protein
MKIFYCFFIIFCLTITSAFAQENYKSYAFELYGGYSQLNFLNSTFSQNLNNGAINRENLSFELGMRAVTRFVLINGSFISNSYKVSNGNTLFENKATVFRGFEGGVSLFLMPLISKYFSPYIGIGYLGGSINLEEDVTTGGGSSQKTTTNKLATSTLQTPLWKFGAMAAYKRISLAAEYKQSFSTPETAFQQFAITLAYRIIKR